MIQTQTANHRTPYEIAGCPRLSASSRPREMAGTIRWLNEDRSYGVIQPDDNSPQLFFDRLSYPAGEVALLSTHQPVAFELIVLGAARRAVNVRRKQ